MGPVNLRRYDLVQRTVINVNLLILHRGRDRYLWDFLGSCPVGIFPQQEWNKQQDQPTFAGVIR